MSKIKERAVTYSLLANIRNKGNLVNGTIGLYVPLIKRVLSKINASGISSGDNIKEIRSEAETLYGIDFPLPVLRTILKAIAKEVNGDTENHFILHNDDSFQIRNYTFVEFEEEIQTQTTQINYLEKLFKEFCQTCDKEDVTGLSLLEFIEKNKLSLSKYLAHKEVDDKAKDYTTEAQFVDYFKNIPNVYEVIQRIYLGSILVGYLEYKTENIKTNIELLIDTNFLLGLLDLNTPESTHTCRKIIDITKEQGYKLSILSDTIDETVGLLKAKAENFNSTFLQKKLYPEDIYNACDRRKLTPVDLERIIDNIEQHVAEFNLFIVHDTKKYRNLAKYSNEYETLKKIRNSEASAMHDAIAIQYVREKRKKKIKEFENVNCWFINNSVNRDRYDNKEATVDFQPEIIKADDFLNIIWLSNPQIENLVDANEITRIGLTSLISNGITRSLPKLAIIRELDDNIHKYSGDGGLTDADIVRVATRITTRQLTDIEQLNKLAKKDKERFVKSLSEEASRQKELDEERLKKIDKVIKDFTQKSHTLQKIKTEFDSKAKLIDKELTDIKTDVYSKDQKIDSLTKDLEAARKSTQKAQDEMRRIRRENYIDEQVGSWRAKARTELLLWLAALSIGLIILGWYSGWNANNMISLITKLKTDIIISAMFVACSTVFTSISLKKWYDRHHNHSNIENYKKGLKVPSELSD